MSRITSKALRVSLPPCQNSTRDRITAPVAFFYVLDADPWTQLTGFPPKLLATFEGIQTRGFLFNSNRRQSTPPRLAANE
jgi:hypothetical protein